jgi:disulfide bond formation protein DsbB
MAAVGIIGLLAAIHAPKGALGRRAWGSLAFLAAAIGAAIAARHVWLQHLPPEKVPACGPGLDFMLQSMPSYLDVVKKVLAGSGECAEVNWSFLGFSMPEWTLLVFVLLAVGALAAGFGKRL